MLGDLLTKFAFVERTVLRFLSGHAPLRLPTGVLLIIPFFNAIALTFRTVNSSLADVYQLLIRSTILCPFASNFCLLSSSMTTRSSSAYATKLFPTNDYDDLNRSLNIRFQ